MLTERIQEILEFTKSESPYRKANKGWINQDVFLDLSPSADIAKQKSETAQITLFWSPIRSFLSNIFWIIVIGSTIVFTSSCISRGKLNLSFSNRSEIINMLEVDEIRSKNINEFNEIKSTNITIQQEIDSQELAEKNKINLFDGNQIKLDQDIINQTTDEQEISIEESNTNKDIKILQKNMPKPNFI